ncbi:IclR family transcriptional regulator [Nitrospirillum viridazoti]|nr:IclR family transcriptional regulator [Nitrospirillum amazonense]TWB31000.1 IclR family transcriptional regulator [Nitrospirillum amazonense]
MTDQFVAKRVGAKARLVESSSTVEIGKGNGGPRAMSRVLDLFDLLARRRQGMTLSELSQALDVPKSTFVSSLRALVADGFLIMEGGLYQLGPGAYRLAGTILSSWSLPDLVRHYVRELASTTGESVGFAIADWDIGQAIYTDAVNSPQPVHYAMRVGLRAPLYASAAGRVLLAHAPANQRQAYFARAHLRPLTPATRTSPEQVEESLDEIRRLGYCASFGEMLPDTAAIAVPVHDANDAVLGALIVAAPIERLRNSFPALLAHTVRVGRQASGLATDDDLKGP